MKILVVDDDASIRDVVSEFLEEQGFGVETAANGATALEIATKGPPDLIVLDVEMPDMTGYEVCQAIKKIPSLANVPVIMLTALAGENDEVVGFESGADDYVPKPFRPARLLARIQSAIDRTRRGLDANALTHLPGNMAILKEIEKRIASPAPFSVLYCDLNNFKSFNDRYGFLRGDDAIRMTADLIGRHVERLFHGRAFVGHVGGDDFVAIIDSHDVEALCGAIIKDFDAGVPNLYDKADREKGRISSIDRRGNPVEIPVMGLAIGVVTNRNKMFKHPGEISFIAGDLKKRVKSERGSAFLIDRRMTGGQ